MARLPADKLKNPFTNAIDGVFGRFRTSESYDLYYLMTTFQVSDLDNLVTAAQALPFDSIGFEELVQRDVDYDRVDKEIVRDYLERGRNRVIFFPPLLVTPLIVENRHPKDTYDTFQDKVTQQPSEEQGGCYEAIWDENKFKLELNLQKSDSGYKIRCQEDGSDYFYINYAATLRYNPKAVSLVVIDGQHRLVALKRIIEQGRLDLVSPAEIPVCLFFSPNAVAKEPGAESLLRDMRELFVTINSTSRKVSGHFIVLLNDQSLSALCVRSLADSWKATDTDPGKSYLQMLEWNQRLDSRAAQITKPYSISTVSILSDALATNAFDRRRGATQTLLNLLERKDSLDQPDCPSFSSIHEESFNIAQATVLKEQIEKYVTPSLDHLFRKPGPYVEIWDAYQQAVSWLDTHLDMKGAKQYREEVLNQFRVCQQNDQQSVKDMEELFKTRVSLDEDLTFYRTNVFQNGLVFAWVNLSVALCPKFSISPLEVAKGLVAGLGELCFKSKKRFFDSKRDYLQHIIFRENSIIANETSKRQTGNLILATLLHQGTRKAAVNALDCSTKPDGLSLDEVMSQVGCTAVTDYMEDLQENTRRAVLKNYHFMGFEIETVRFLDAFKGTGDAAKEKQFDARIDELVMSKHTKAVEVLANVLGVPSSHLC